jgi:hypothetical protein
MDDRIILARTKNWIEKFIIKYSICPFAKSPFEKELIRYKIDDSPEFESGLFAFTVFIRELSFDLVHFSNAFLILPNWRGNFESFIDFTEYGYILLEEMNLSHLFQLVAFHPYFHYHEESAEDITNATNQSPFPMIHILKVEEVFKAIESYEDPHQIAFENKKLLSKLSDHQISALNSIKSGK